MILVLLVCLPLFIRLPPFSDIVLYDLWARAILRGQVLYRDLFCNTFPGKIWLHALLRPLIGESGEALRGVEFLILSANIYLLVFSSLSPLCGQGRKCFTAASLYLFYFGAPDWCHLQPDAWMLLPALAALWMRLGQLERLLAGRNRLGPIMFSVVEGLLWGLAIWIKPFVLVPALGCWLVFVVLAVRSRSGHARLIFLDAMMLSLGGLIAGALGLSWLWLTDNWSSFWATMAWNREYLSESGNPIERTLQWPRRLWPWGLIQLLALPAALGNLALAIKKSTLGAPLKLDLIRRALLAAFYLSWFLQANYLQKQHDYQLMPQTLLGLAIVAGVSLPRALVWPARFVTAGFLVWAVTIHPLLQPRRLELWARCWREGYSAELRDRLCTEHIHESTSWVELAGVEEFLRQQEVRDGDVLCYSVSPVPIFADLNLEPPGRFVVVWAYPRLFPSKAGDIAWEVRRGPQRFIVADRWDLGRDAAPSASSVYPWSEEEVFRTERYLVYRVREKPKNRPPAGLPTWRKGKEE